MHVESSVLSSAPKRFNTTGNQACLTKVASLNVFLDIEPAWLNKCQFVFMDRIGYISY